MFLFVSYDLLKQGQDYSGLIRELERLGAKRVHLSVWSIRPGTWTERSLHQHLAQFIDANDRLVVITASSAFGRGLTPMGNL